MSAPVVRDGFVIVRRRRRSFENRVVNPFQPGPESAVQVFGNIRKAGVAGQVTGFTGVGLQVEELDDRAFLPPGFRVGRAFDREVEEFAKFEVADEFVPPGAHAADTQRVKEGEVIIPGLPHRTAAEGAGKAFALDGVRHLQPDEVEEGGEEIDVAEQPVAGPSSRGAGMIRAISMPGS